MKPDDFEKQLQRQLFRQIPTQWRAQILQAARRDSSRRTAAVTPVIPWWREWLWPCPQAWAGLAAAWLMVLGLNVAAPARPGEVAKRLPATSSDTETTLAAQRRELARLLDNNSPEPTPAPRMPPGPRSEGIVPSKV